MKTMMSRLGWPSLLLLSACVQGGLGDKTPELIYQTGREMARRACFQRDTEAQVQECLRQQAQSYEDYRQQRERITPVP